MGSTDETAGANNPGRVPYITTLFTFGRFRRPSEVSSGLYQGEEIRRPEAITGFYQLKPGGTMEKDCCQKDGIANHAREMRASTANRTGTGRRADLRR